MDNQKNFITDMETKGLHLIEDILSGSEIDELKKSVVDAIKEEAEFHKTTDYSDYGMILLCAKYGGAFIKILENNKVMAPFENLLGDDCIVYANTSSSMPPKATNYSSRIHVDGPVRQREDYFLRVSGLVLLDDFTAENGATWYLPGSQNLTEAPSDESFYNNAIRLEAKAGSILYWDPHLWHAGGINKTALWRHALTIVMVRPFMKQRLDIPRVLGSSGVKNLSEKAKKRLGFYSQPPVSYSDYYAPIEKRTYK